MKAHSDEIYDKSMQGTCGVAIFIRLAVNAFEILAVQGHPKSLMVQIESAYATSY